MFNVYHHTKIDRLNLAAGSRGPDVDTDVEVVSRRVAAVRRSMAKSEEQSDMAKEILEEDRPKGVARMP